MKNKYSIVFYLIFLVTSTSFAQHNNAFTKDVIPVSPEAVPNNKAIRNPNATAVVVKGVTVDKRAARYYNPEDFADMSAEKAKKLNFIYVESYQLQTPESELGNVCLDKIKHNLDLGQYHHLRKPTERAIASVNIDGCEFKISLYSFKEIENFK